MPTRPGHGADVVECRRTPLPRTRVAALAGKAHGTPARRRWGRACPAIRGRRCCAGAGDSSSPPRSLRRNSTAPSGVLRLRGSASKAGEPRWRHWSISCGGMACPGRGPLKMSPASLSPRSIRMPSMPCVRRNAIAACSSESDPSSTCLRTAAIDALNTLIMGNAPRRYAHPVRESLSRRSACSSFDRQRLSMFWLHSSLSRPGSPATEGSPCGAPGFRAAAAGPGHFLFAW